MKKTAVEWFEQKLDDLDIEIPFGIFEEAKEMEKEQIIEAWNTRSKIDDVLTFTDDRTAEQYYNETYKSE